MQILRRIGVEIPRATLSFWVIKCAELLGPLSELLRANILNYDVAYSNETTLQVLKEPKKLVQCKKYMWLFAVRLSNTYHIDSLLTSESSNFNFRFYCPH